MLRKLARRLSHWLQAGVQRCRVRWYSLMSTARVVDGGARIDQPLLATGHGVIELGRCHLGVPYAGFFSGYINIEARGAGALVSVGDGVVINNNACIIAERGSISIGADTLIGPDVFIADSDFHHLDRDKRLSGAHTTSSVRIGRNVFIGGRVAILKGVTIGDDSVIGFGSVVTRSLPPGVIASGNPCRVMKTLDLPR